MTFPPSQPGTSRLAQQRATGHSRRGRLVLLLAVLLPLVLFGALFAIPATRGVLSDHIGLTSGVFTVVLIGAVVLGFRALARQERAADEDQSQARSAWAAARGWRYRAQPRQIPPDALTEVDPRLRPEPVTVSNEASGAFNGRNALVHSRDISVRVRAAVVPSRREVVGVESQIDLPQVVIETGLARVASVAGYPDRAEIAVYRQAEGLSRVPIDAGCVLWVPPGLERRIADVVRPVLQAHAQGLSTERTILACVGRWLLLSARSDPSAAAAEWRLAVTADLASALEAGAVR